MFYEVETVHGVHQVRRTTTKVTEIGLLLDALAAMPARLAALPPRRALLFDLRAAFPRNDPAFEKAVDAIVPVIVAPYERVAFLVMTAAGVLQLKRLSTSATTRVFHDDLDGALGYLTRR